MARRSSAVELVFPSAGVPPRGTRLEWLYRELRNAILSARLRRGAQMPATRELAAQYALARGTVVSVFEQLEAEGYVESRRGKGTFVSERLPDDLLSPASVPEPLPSRTPLPSPPSARPPRAFRINEPALDAFPAELWARIGSKRLLRLSRAQLAGGDPRGYAPLREAVADYLASSRGVRCASSQVIILSGAQHALDLIARLLIHSGDEVWMEDPGYSGAITAFERVGAKIIPVPVDERGIDVGAGEQRAPNARAAYITPAHQFPLGYSMPLERRLKLLDWAARANALIIEDDYDSEFRFQNRPLPSLQGLDSHGNVAFIGSFNKALFPALRLGYVVLPEKMVDDFARLRFRVDRYPAHLEQSILCDFITQGHFSRHLRRMRSLYQSRLHALREAVEERLGGVLTIPSIEAGLQTPALVRSNISSPKLLQAATERGLEVVGLHRYAIERTDVAGLMLGFAAINEAEIRRGVSVLADAFTAQVAP